MRNIRKERTRHDRDTTKQRKVKDPRCVDVNPKKLDLIENRTKCSGFECQMSVRPYQTSFHLSSQCCACRTDNDNLVDLENDIRHDVPSLLEANQHEITCTYYIVPGRLVQRRDW